MPTVGLNHINLSGNRALLNALKDFYCDIIGLEVGARPDFERFGYWLYAGGHPVVHLYESAPNETRNTDVLTAFDHVGFTCEDSDEFEALLRRRHIEYSKAVVPGSDQVQQLFLRDPAGIKVELNFPADAG
jgi:catechol 2,3-dioxygenase-like lactoylglutathione lyase family enzyme